MASLKGHRDADDRLFDQAVGARIREIRLSRGLTQSQVADLAGVRFQQLGKYERGQDRVAVSRLARLADALGVPASRLLGEGERLDVPGQSAALRLAQDFNRCSPAAQRVIQDLVRSFVPRSAKGPSPPVSSENP